MEALKPAAPAPAPYDNGISLLRVIAAFAVIMLHAAAGVAGDVHRGFNRSWWAANILDAASRFCVPLFLMISGALLLGYKKDDVSYTGRRLKRVIVPLAFWTVVYVLAGHLKNPGEMLRAPQEVLVSLRHGLMNGVAYHLWYVYMLIGLLLFLPVFNAWIRVASRRHLEIFLAICAFFILSGQPWFDPFLPNINGHYFGGYASYIVLGYYLYHYRTFFHRYSWLPYLLYAGTVAVTAYGTFYVNNGRNDFSELFYSYMAPGVVLMTIAVFVIGQQFRNRTLPRWMRAADASSYGIYLVHILVMEYAWMLVVKATDIGTLQIVLWAVCTFLISFLIVWLLRRVPQLRNLVG